MNRVGSGAALAALFVFGSAAYAAEPTDQPGSGAPCTLADCVTLAIAHGPDLRGKEASIDVAEIGKRRAGANYGPKLQVSGGVQVWNDESTAAFDIPVPGLTIPPIVVRDQVTWSVNVTIAQPLSGLWQIYQANQLAELGVDVAKLERDATKSAIAMSVTEAWLNAVLADDLVAVSKTSLEARNSDRERAGALVKAGVIVEADLLRADLGVTQAKQALALAERRGSLARARLSQLVGKPVTPEKPTPGAQGEVASLEAAKREALEQRIELKEVRTRVQQARSSVDLAWSKMAPTVNLIAQAQFQRAAAFGEDAAAFVGVTFDWTVWEWGATKLGIDEARAHVREAEAGLQQLEEGIGLEVEAAWVEHASAVDQAALAAEAVKVSDENYQLVRTRFANKAATAFDLVTAETDLTNARTNEQLAIINGYVARARLARAMGKSAEDIAKEGTP